MIGMTKREAQVITLLFESNDTERIAWLLRLSPGTVRVHIHNVCRKAGVRGKLGLVALAWKQGGFLY